MWSPIQESREHRPSKTNGDNSRREAGMPGRGSWLESCSESGSHKFLLKAVRFLQSSAACMFKGLHASKIIPMENDHK